MALTQMQPAIAMAELEARICASLDRLGLEVTEVKKVEIPKASPKQQYFLREYDDQGAVLAEAAAIKQSGAAMGMGLAQAVGLGANKPTNKVFDDDAKWTYFGEVNKAEGEFNPFVSGAQQAFCAGMAGTAAAQTQRVETEDEMLARLLKARGLVAVTKEEAETVTTVSTETLGETVSPTPRGLTVLSALPGFRMGAAAWQAE